MYFVRDPDGHEWAFDYSDILTEGFRTISLGESVRFIAREEARGTRARCVVRLQDDGDFLHYLE